ncbi:FcoT family thioesterase [Streptomyces sp. NPDC012421]|uniref:FcoT family thioesterase n=1 Tax=Streptomyces sp. NPDC012421 TaxID=3364832 RepID=UPI0036E3930C
MITGTPDPGTSHASAPGSDTDDRLLLARVLAPYKPHCRYLRHASLEPGETDGRPLTGMGAFTIPEPCYIDDTGHFNAVEFNICFNQLAYYTLAATIRDRVRGPFGEWTMNDYWARQLPHILILDMHSRFRRAMRGDDFRGEVQLVDVRRKSGRSGPLLLIDTLGRFWDEHGGRCEGKVRVAVTDPPA